jgi:hypothetical protein
VVDIGIAHFEAYSFAALIIGHFGMISKVIKHMTTVTVSVLYSEGNRREYNISEKQWFRGGSQVKSR